MGSFVILIPMLAAMYFLMIRPQQRRMREREAMVRAAGVGDEVATVGGVIGTIVAEEGADIVALEIDTDVELRVQRRARSHTSTAPWPQSAQPARRWVRSKSASSAASVAGARRSG